jgi:hypothetical protein
MKDMIEATSNLRKENKNKSILNESTDMSINKQKEKLFQEALENGNRNLKPILKNKTNYFNKTPTRNNYFGYVPAGTRKKSLKLPSVKHVRFTENTNPFQNKQN